MTKLLKGLLCLTLVFGLGACSSSSDKDYDLAATKDYVISGELEMVPPMDFLSEESYTGQGFTSREEAFEALTGLNPENLTEFEYISTMMMPGFLKILMVEAKEDKLADVKAEVDSFVAKAQGEAFYPADQDAARNPEIYEDGNLIVVVMAGNAAEIMDSIKENLK